MPKRLVLHGLTEGEFVRLKVACIEAGKTMTSLVLELIRDFLRKIERERRGER
jgi:hypothetical protein